MSKKNHENTAEFVGLLRGLSQVMRCCCRDEAFCEGVTFHQFMILDAVAGSREMLMADLHTWLAVEKSTTTRLVNPLIAKRLLKREAVAHDSRAVTLTLTSEGKKTHKKVQACVADFFQRVLDNIPAKKR
ncbi:MAG: MarR family winged helix-turn-helix transcriptional regulator, partial [Smithella sp.]|nr:MarR family winged helix-turn-helix transcriptional regulator [Smithella sp.]